MNTVSVAWGLAGVGVVGTGLWYVLVARPRAIAAAKYAADEDARRQADDAKKRAMLSNPFANILAATQAMGTAWSAIATSEDAQRGAGTTLRATLDFLAGVGKSLGTTGAQSGTGKATATANDSPSMM